MDRQSRIRILFDGEEMQLLHLPGRSDHSVVTFDIMHARANGRSGFAMQLALRHDLDLYAVVPRRLNWYPAAEALICADRVAALKDRPSLGYGASMGGYGVLKYGAAMRLDATFAMSPQDTIDPAIDNLAHAVAISGNPVLSRKLARLGDRRDRPATEHAMSVPPHRSRLVQPPGI